MARNRALGNRLRAGGNVFSPLSLFAAGEQGVWYDPSDFSTLFQDSAGTTPVTGSGQPVGKILDKSGRGNHLTQGTSAARPVLTQDGSGFWYLAFDGVDDALVSPSTVNMSGGTKATLWAGVTKTSDIAAAIVVELTANANTTSGGIFLAGPDLGGATNYALTVHGGTATAQSKLSAYAAPVSNVISAALDNAAATAAAAITPRVNGVTPTIVVAGAAPGGAAFANATLYLGARGGSTVPLVGRIYQLILRGAASDATAIASGERYVGSKMGIAL